MVEGRVEADDLRKIGVDPGNGADSGEIVGLVERRERAKRLQGVEQDRVDPLRRGKAGAAVNDPVADRDDLPVTKMVRGPCKQIFEQIGMGQRRPSGQSRSIRTSPSTERMRRAGAIPIFSILPLADKVRLSGLPSV